MSNDRRDETTSRESGIETSKGAQKLQLSITRMKKLRSAVKGGPQQEQFESTASDVWLSNDFERCSLGWRTARAARLPSA